LKFRAKVETLCGQGFEHFKFLHRLLQNFATSAGQVLCVSAGFVLVSANN